MLSKNQIKYLRSLHLKKQRQKYNIFLVEGDKIASELILSTKYSVQAVYALKNWVMQNSTLLKNINEVYEISDKELRAISMLKTPNQVLVVGNRMEDQVNYSLRSEANMIYLDDIQNPGNVGTILRIADWFGIPLVVRSANTADFYNPKVIQSSMGSFLRVDLITAEFEELCKSQKGHKFYAADMNGENIFNVEFETPSVLIFGNEGSGLSDKILQSKPIIMSIPGVDKYNSADSLNVAVSAGIICSIFHQKQKP